MYIEKEDKEFLFIIAIVMVQRNSNKDSDQQLSRIKNIIVKIN